MVKNDAEIGNREISEISGNDALSENFGVVEKKEISSDFLETLRRSGLDISSFETAEKNPKSAEFLSTKPENPERSTVENEFSQSFVTPQEKNNGFLKGFGKWKKLSVGAGIAIVIALQSVFQFSLIGNENLQIFEDLSRNEVTVELENETPAIAEIPEIEEVPQVVKVSEIKEIIEEKKEVEAENIRNKREISVQPPKIALTKQRQSVDTPLPSANRKKEQRATRLRRAEKILTGV